MSGAHVLACGVVYLPRGALSSAHLNRAKSTCPHFHSGQYKKPVGPRPVGGRTRFVSRFQKRLRAQRNFGFATKRAASGNGASGAAKFIPRGTTYVFVNVVVAPRYVARVQPGSGGLKQEGARGPGTPLGVENTPKGAQGGGAGKQHQVRAGRMALRVGFDV